MASYLLQIMQNYFVVNLQPQELTTGWSQFRLN